MQRFFVEPYQIEKEAHRIHINGTDVNHIKNVLRMKCGEDVWISDGGDKEYRCQIGELGEDDVLLHILYAQDVYKRQDLVSLSVRNRTQY